MIRSLCANILFVCGFTSKWTRFGSRDPVEEFGTRLRLNIETAYLVQHILY